MSGEFCGVWCGWCGRCDTDYTVRCLTLGCRNAVTFPDLDIYCGECLQAMALQRAREQNDQRNERRHAS